MPTPEEVDAAGSYGPIDLHNGGGTAYVARWQDSTYQGEPIVPGRWYHLLSTDLVTSLGMIECSTGTFYAFRPESVVDGLGDACDSMNEAIRVLAARGMSVWVPWDADPEETADLHVIRDDIPTSARAALLAWLWDRLNLHGNSVNYSHGYVAPETVHDLQTSLRVDFGYPPKGNPLVDTLLDNVAGRGDKLLLRVVDLLAAEFSPTGNPYSPTPSQIEDLKWHLDTSSAAIDLVVVGEGYRLRKRLPEGVEEAVQAAIDLDAKAGRHLAEAWTTATAMDPNTSHAMAEAIRAVDVASGAVVIPKDKKPTMFKAVQVMKDQGDWGLVLQDSDGYPDHSEVLLGMMETVAKAQPDRHGGNKPSPLEAQAHVQLAATLVHWFASGAIVRTAKK